MPRCARGTTLDFHPQFGFYWHHLWKFQGQGQVASMPVAASKNVANAPVLDGALPLAPLYGAEYIKIAQAAHVRVYGATWVVDQREPAAPIDVFSMNEHQPNVFQWLFLDGTEPARRLGTTPDPWLTWEVRTHVGQGGALPVGRADDARRRSGSPTTAPARAPPTRRRRAGSNVWSRSSIGSVATHFDRGADLMGVRV